MKISVVTISFNQARFLGACLGSIASQKGPWEHIVVDPGSNDGSREIIQRQREQFSHVIFEPDRGPADGLNKGFSRATGDIIFYLNSDDVVWPGAFEEARSHFKAHPHLDVISGHGFIIDESGTPKRRVYSDPVTRLRLAHGGAIRIQPATFIRRNAFIRAGGFNEENRSNWDGELIVDLFLQGAKFGIVNSFWGGYRLHDDSITATAKLDELMKIWDARRYEKLMGRPVSARAVALRRFYRLDRVLRHPDVLLARLAGHRVYGAKKI